jgi:hypothetical protein
MGIVAVELHKKIAIFFAVDRAVSLVGYCTVLLVLNKIFAVPISPSLLQVALKRNHA